MQIIFQSICTTKGPLHPVPHPHPPLFWINNLLALPIPRLCQWQAIVSEPLFLVSDHCERIGTVTTYRPIRLTAKNKTSLTSSERNKRNDKHTWFQGDNDIPVVTFHQLSWSDVGWSEMLCQSILKNYKRRGSFTSDDKLLRKYNLQFYGFSGKRPKNMKPARI